jgi:hypothetical protein
MIEQIEELVRFYSHQHHVPIGVQTDSYQVETWDRSGLAVAMPGDSTTSRKIGNMLVLHQPDFAKSLSGDLVVIDDMPVARVGKQWLVLLLWPKNTPALAFACKIVDQHLPRICRQYRREMREQLVESIGHCVHDRKRELQSSIREDSYELERLSLQQMQLARKLETDRAVLKMFERSPEWIKARATRTFVDMMKLVPGTYAGFGFKEDSVVGVTHQIDIEHDAYAYHFDRMKWRSISGRGRSSSAVGPMSTAMCTRMSRMNRQTSVSGTSALSCRVLLASWISSDCSSWFTSS